MEKNPIEDLLEAQSLLWDTKCDIPIMFSGGKDSLAMVLKLKKAGVDMSRVVLHHHDVDGHGPRLFDWPCTPAYCKAVADHLGVPILFSWREGGIRREILRQDEGLQDVLYQPTRGAEPKRLKSRPGSSTRMKFPAVAASLMTRWCSAVVTLIDHFVNSKNMATRNALWDGCSTTDQNYRPKMHF